MRGFSEWFDKILFEFNKTNLYDFYALEIGKNLVNNPEVIHKLVASGNDLLFDIFDTIGLLLVDRYCPDINFNLQNKRWGEDKLVEFLPHYKNEIEQHITDIHNFNYRDAYYMDIINNPKKVAIWDGMNRRQRREFVILCHDILEKITQENEAHMSNSLTGAWQAIYKFWVENYDSGVVQSPEAIIKKVDKLLQIIHNNGSLLQYMPPELDRGLQYRDNVAHINQLLMYASDEVRGLLRSAAISHKDAKTKVNHGQMLLTALIRSLKSPKFSGSDYVPHHISLKKFTEIAGNPEEWSSRFQSEYGAVNSYEEVVYEITAKVYGDADEDDLIFDVICNLYNFKKDFKIMSVKIDKNSIRFPKMDFINLGWLYGRDLMKYKDIPSFKGVGQDNYVRKNWITGTEDFKYTDFSQLSDKVLDIIKNFLKSVARD
jgi:hypothetical protein